MKKRVRTKIKHRKIEAEIASYDDVAQLIGEMTGAGAEFRFLSGGSLIVVNLNSLPCGLVDRFLKSNSAALVAAVRVRQAKAV